MKIKRILLSSKAIALMLLLFGYVWIITSDFIAAYVNGNTFSLLNIQVLKGLLFITIAAAVVYILLYLKDKELDQSRRYTDSILETIDVAILVMNQDGQIDSVNNAFVNIFGYTRKEIVGRHFTTLLSKETHGKGNQNFQQLIEGTSLPNEEWVINDKSGKPISLLINSEVLESDEDKYLILSAMDITDQKQTQAKLEHSLVEKEVLLSEIHHRVNNNLAIISGLMQLQIFDEDNPKLKEKLISGITRIQAIGSIHELLYQSNSLVELRFDKSIEKLLENLSSMYNQHQTINLDLNLSPITININQGVPACLVINEIVTNALQHAFSAKEQGLISIDLSQSNDEVLTLTISDNGKGLPDHFTSISQDGSLGFQLVDTLLRQLDAEHTVDSTRQGTKFSFSFKKTSKKGSSSSFVN
ncbi:PAS domain S-box protein [Fodinibius sp.]|uniref:sensor histidine kinase n=1 Tax=Fodinibius sp. TaxID=1872440 RepID=UPI002ACD6FE3|nr:PAS domain S-box protein [Fodinibius sp.]MDZ7660362.1 PAS domain S-box protein [Fodinibius sp.]